MSRTRVLCHATVITASMCLALTGLVGCTSMTVTRHAPVSPTPSSSAPQLEGQPRGVVGSTDVPTGVKNVASKRTSVTLSGCAATKTGWDASGKITNNTGSTASYKITIYFTDTGSTVVGWVQKAVAVPGKTTRSGTRQPPSPRRNR